MKTMFTLVLICAIGIGLALGLSIQQKVDAKQTALTAEERDHFAEVTPASMIGVYNCDGWVGAIIVTGDGTLHPEQAVSETDAVNLAKKLGILDKAGHALHIFPLAGQCPDKQTT